MKKVRDLNDCTVIYRIGSLEKSKRARRAYTDLHPHDPNQLMIVSCITKPLRNSITGDGLKEWLIRHGRSKPRLYDPEIWLKKLVDMLPQQQLNEYNQLISEIKDIKKIMIDEEAKTGFLSPEVVAAILLQGNKPFLEETLIPLMNYKVIFQDNMFS